jgi:integrase
VFYSFGASPTAIRSKARSTFITWVVLGRHKDRPKNNAERTIALCPRALSVLTGQIALRERFVAAGKVHHDHVFFKDDGEPICSLQYVYGRWCSTIDRLAVHYRAPYNARHSCVSWHLMVGRISCGAQRSLATASKSCSLTIGDGSALPLKQTSDSSTRRWRLRHPKRRVCDWVGRGEIRGLGDRSRFVSVPGLEYASWWKCRLA